MKKFLAFAALICGPLLSKSQLYTAKSTTTQFFSEAPLENIEATNKSAVVVFKPGSGDVQIRITIMNFNFKNALMGEHFNENYMESDKFPYAEFKGKLNEPLDQNKDGETKVSVTGKLTIHGVQKDVTLNGTIVKTGKEYTLATKFKVKVTEYNIKVPSMYVKNIAEEVEVAFTSTLEPYEKKN